MGASQEDIDYIEEKIMIQNEARANNSKGSRGGRRRGTVQSYNARKSRVSGPGANKRQGISQPRGNTQASADYDEEDDEDERGPRHMGGYNQ